MADKSLDQQPVAMSPVLVGSTEAALTDLIIKLEDLPDRIIMQQLRIRLR